MQPKKLLKTAKPKTPNLTRRTFLKALAAGVGVAAAGTLVTKKPEKPTNQPQSNNFRLKTGVERTIDVTQNYSQKMHAAAGPEIERIKKEMIKLNALVENFFKERGVEIPKFEIIITDDLITCRIKTTKKNLEAIQLELSQILTTEGQEALRLHKVIIEKTEEYLSKEKQPAQNEQPKKSNLIRNLLAAVFGAGTIGALVVRGLRSRRKPTTNQTEQVKQTIENRRRQKAPETKPLKPEPVKKPGERTRRMEEYIRGIVVEEIDQTEKLSSELKEALTKRLLEMQLRGVPVNRKTAREVLEGLRQGQL